MLGFISCVLGFAGLSLAMDRHHRQVADHAASPVTRRTPERWLKTCWRIWTSARAPSRRCWVSHAKCARGYDGQPSCQHDHPR
ncbi:DUF3325 domain-containing protein [Vreelandella alkaliphila]|uniref:DUF3325 domain-containing protein n=1 Tax=Vreelandella alkaliphila TaxID=272774 RepID=UPI003F98E04C